MKKNDTVILKDWTGNTLFKGNYKSTELNKILILNRDSFDDLYLLWDDENRLENVWEYVW